MYEFKKDELISHIDKMINRDPESYKYIVNNLKKDKLINLILSCQGDSEIQKGGYQSKYRSSGWGFMF